MENSSSNLNESRNLTVDYRARKREITNGMMLTFLLTLKRILIVWSPDDNVKPDMVVPVLTKYDKNAQVFNHYIKRSLLSKEKSWLGAVVEYSYENLAVIAAKDVRMVSKSIKTMLFKDYLNILLEEEVRHMDYHRRGTWVLIRGSQSFLENQIFHFEMDLHEFGNVLDIRFFSGYEEYGLICEVKYEFSSQAIVAKTMLNGQFRRNVGYLAVEIEETVKERSLLGCVKDRIQETENTESKKTMEELLINF